NSKARTQESEVSAQSEFHTGDIGQCAAHQYFVFDALPDLSSGNHGRAILLTDDLFVLHLYPFAGIGKRHKHLSGNRGLSTEFSRNTRHSSRPEAGPSRAH